MDVADWVDRFNRRGAYGAGTNPCEKKIVEKGMVSDFFKKMKIEFEFVEEGERPDFYVKTSNFDRLGIECTELCNQRKREEVVHNFENDPDCKHSGKHTDYKDWTSDCLKERIESILDKKNNNYQRAGIYVDVLIIGTTELWLMPSKVNAWIGDIQFTKRTTIGSAFLLLFHNRDDQGIFAPFRILGDTQVF